MENITEAIFRKYDAGTTPGDGEILWSRIFFHDEYLKKEKAIKRMCRIIEVSDPLKREWVFNDTVTIRKVAEDANFNDDGVVIFEKVKTENKATTHKAAQRLARYLTSKKDGFVYFGGYKTVGVGKNVYMFATRGSQILNTKDKETYLRRKLGGRKGALTRSLIKLKKIRDAYRKTLFPDGYKEDKKFKQLMRYLPNQKSRVWEAKRMTLADVEHTNGDIENNSIPSLMKLVATM